MSNLNTYIDSAVENKTNYSIVAQMLGRKNSSKCFWKPSISSIMLTVIANAAVDNVFFTASDLLLACEQNSSVILYARSDSKTSVKRVVRKEFTKLISSGIVNDFKKNKKTCLKISFGSLSAALQNIHSLRSSFLSELMFAKNYHIRSSLINNLEKCKEGQMLLEETLHAFKYKFKIPGYIQSLENEHRVLEETAWNTIVKGV